MSSWEKSDKVDKSTILVQSTMFNALCENGKAEAANYPFCTIEPNVGIVAVPDTRLQAIPLRLFILQAVGRLYVSELSITSVLKSLSKAGIQGHSNCTTPWTCYVHKQALQAL